MINVYEARLLGRKHNETEGSDHYKTDDGVEPIDLMISMGHDTIEGFCTGNMIKYARRFKITRNVADLKKVADYANILTGITIYEQEQERVEI